MCVGLSGSLCLVAYKQRYLALSMQTTPHMHTGSSRFLQMGTPCHALTG